MTSRVDGQVMGDVQQQAVVSHKVSSSIDLSHSKHRHQLLLKNGLRDVSSIDLCLLIASLALWLRRPPRELKIRGSNPTCDRIFLGRVKPVDFKIGTPMATLPGTWYYRVSAGTGQPSVSIL